MNRQSPPGASPPPIQNGAPPPPPQSTLVVAVPPSKKSGKILPLTIGLPTLTLFPITINKTVNQYKLGELPAAAEVDRKIADPLEAELKNPYLDSKTMLKAVLICGGCYLLYKAQLTAGVVVKVVFRFDTTAALKDELLNEVIVTNLCLGTYSLPIQVALPEENNTPGHIIVMIESVARGKALAQASRYVAYPVIDGQISRLIAL